MFQLILVVIAIALTAAMVIASINYIPWWYKSAADTEQTMRSSLSRLEQTYDVVVRAANGQAPSTTSEADGGLMSQFGHALKFTPAAPAGYTWVYGLYPDDGSRYANLNFFCLTPTGGGASEGVYRGLERARAVYSREQVVLSTQCGHTTDWAKPSSYPAKVHMTVFVQYTPGVTL